MVTSKNNDILKRETNTNKNLSSISRNIANGARFDSSVAPAKKVDSGVNNNIFTPTIKGNKPSNNISANIIKNATDAWNKKQNSNNSVTPVPDNNVGNSYTPTVPNNNEVVRVRDYLSPYLDIPVNYDNGTGEVYVAGYKLPVTHFSDGRSYAKKSDIDSIINTVKSNPDSKYAIANNILGYRDSIDDISRRITQNKKFSYDPYSDPVYRSYVDQIDRMRDDAVREAVSASVARTGGYMNSNAAAVAYKIASDYDNMKADLIPTLEAQAYSRYSDNRNYNAETQNIIGNLLSQYNNNLVSLYNDKNSADVNKYGTDIDNEQFNSTHSLDERIFEYQKLIGEKELNEKVRQFNMSHELSFEQLSLQEKSYLLEKWATEKRLNAAYTEPPLSTYPNYTGNTTSHSGTLVPVS